jgi:hypothetical protein
MDARSNISAGEAIAILSGTLADSGGGTDP